MDNNLHRENTTLEDMHNSDRHSESSRLVAPSSTSKPSYLNLISNFCAIVFNGIIAYCCFSEDVTLFSFHPILMSLGVSLTSSCPIFCSVCFPSSNLVFTNFSGWCS